MNYWKLFTISGTLYIVCCYFNKEEIPKSYLLLSKKNQSKIFYSECLFIFLLFTLYTLYNLFIYESILQRH